MSMSPSSEDELVKCLIEANCPIENDTDAKRVMERRTVPNQRQRFLSVRCIETLPTQQLLDVQQQCEQLEQQREQLEQQLAQQVSSLSSSLRSSVSSLSSSLRSSVSSLSSNLQAQKSSILSAA